MDISKGLASLESLIGEAQDIIRDNRQLTIYDSALLVEAFLAKLKIPVNPHYDEKDYYTYNAYPIINFIDICNTFNIEVKPVIDSRHDTEGNTNYSNYDARCKPFIYNFIHNAHFKRFELVKFFNIFFPHTNRNFGFQTYEAPARLNKSLTMTYVHPKYMLEEVLHQLCLIENVDKFDELRIRLSELINQWTEIQGSDPLDRDGSKWKHFNQFDSTQITILSTISTLNAPIIRCFYDRHLPVIITNELGVGLIEHVISSTTANYTRKDSSAKSFFDNRIRNTIFRIGDKQIVKVFPLLDYEVVPLSESAVMNIPSAKHRHQVTNHQMKEREVIMDCDSNIALRLVFNEYITYDIIGAADVAAIKLQIFSYLYQTYGINRLSFTERTVAGTYYPFEYYIKELRVKSIKKVMLRKADLYP